MSILLAAICLAAQQQPQNPIKQRKPAASVLTDPRPVTCEEASKVFDSSRTYLNRALKTHLPATALPKSSKAISREQVVEEMTTIIHQLKPDIKFTPRAQPFTASVLKIQPSEMENLKMLIRLGYVGKVSPLATNRSDTLSLRQFGDSLGFFLSRTAELTHMPTPKWSPILGAGS